MTCTIEAARLSAYLEGDVAGEACADLERHLADCAACRTVLAELRGTLELLRQLPTPPAPDLAVAVAARIDAGEAAPWWSRLVRLGPPAIGLAAASLAVFWVVAGTPEFGPTSVADSGSRPLGASAVAAPETPGDVALRRALEDPHAFVARASQDPTLLDPLLGPAWRQGLAEDLATALRETGRPEAAALARRLEQVPVPAGE